MNADAFRHFYNYHFAQNRKLWDTCIMPLSQEQFLQPLTYSIGSVRDQVVHLINVDNGWFSDLRGTRDVASLPDETEDRVSIRAHWDTVEQHMRAYLAGVNDEMLFEKPIPEGEDKNLILWQILLHVANHGTDHRAQLLRQLNDLGVQTEYQDYIFYTYGNP